MNSVGVSVSVSGSGSVSDGDGDGVRNSQKCTNLAGFGDISANFA
ncbi:hypothetical protein [Microbacterium sp.]|nr:hypothetical protein [Microbacterium sp.]